MDKIISVLKVLENLEFRPKRRHGAETSYFGAGMGQLSSIKYWLSCSINRKFIVIAISSCAISISQKTAKITKNCYFKCTVHFLQFNLIRERYPAEFLAHRNMGWQNKDSAPDKLFT